MRSAQVTPRRNEPPHLRPQKLAAAAKALAVIATLPKCSARSKTTGERCRQIALENGKCHYHGGSTPKGRDWHRVQLPKPGASPKQQQRALEKIKRRQKQAAMRRTKARVEDRPSSAHQRAMRPGTPAERAMRRQDREASALLAAVREAQTVPAAADTRRTTSATLWPGIACGGALTEIDLKEDRQMTKSRNAADEAPDEARSRVKRAIATEGLGVAYEALLEVAKDRTAPAPARATAGVALFRAAGVFDREAGDDLGEMSFEDMTPEQLDRAKARLLAKHRALDEQAARDGGGVFD
jgi:hypothetical protein